MQIPIMVLPKNQSIKCVDPKNRLILNSETVANLLDPQAIGPWLLPIMLETLMLVRPAQILLIF
jgi:hypothetical protein